MPTTSSADPDKLQRYSEDGLGLVDTLRTRSEAVSGAIAALSPNRATTYVPSLGEAHSSLEDLVGDWHHLDDFVGDVAKGFRRAGSDPDGDGVFEAPDGLIAQRGQVGYADRDEARRRGEAWARELNRLRNLGRAPTPAEIQAFARMAGRGQYDPAFAVAFSHAAGAEGYVKATSLIRKAYEPDRVPAAGIAALGVLATTLNTALDTRPGGGRHDPDNATLPADERLGAGFVHDLTSGYQLAGDEHGPGHVGERGDLAVLLRFTDPPTDIAVDIANSRMTPLLGGSYGEYPSERHSRRNPWARYGDPVVNYATMLNRNPDAAGLYLDGRTSNGENNIALVLDHGSGLDGGHALADLVRYGVTDHDLGDSILGKAIDALGDPDNGSPAFNRPSSGKFNPNMHDALAAGVAENMDVIDQRINGGASPGLRSTTIFLSEVASDASAGNRIRQATLDYVTNEASGRNAGALLEVTTRAEINARERAFQTTQRGVGTGGAVIDAGLGLPGAIAGIVGEGAFGATPGKAAAGWVFEHTADYNTAAHGSKIADLHDRLNHDKQSLERQGLTGVREGADNAGTALDNDASYRRYTPTTPL